MLTASVSGYSTWGNGIYAHTVYRIDVTLAGESWSVYRRFSAFFKLHEQVNEKKIVEH
jgi:hypothetical protein